MHSILFRIPMGKKHRRAQRPREDAPVPSQKPETGAVTHDQAIVSRRTLIRGAFGLVIGAVGAVSAGQYFDRKSEPNETPGSPQALRKQILAELQVREELTAVIIRTTEQTLLPQLKSIRSSNPELQKVIDGIASLIEQNMIWADRNFFTAAIRTLKEKDPQKHFTYALHFDNIQRNVTTASEWEFVMTASNIWKIPLPYFWYSLHDFRVKNSIASWVCHEGTMRCQPMSEAPSLRELTVLIHEFVHMVQTHRIMAGPEQAKENYKKNMYKPMAHANDNELSKTIIIDWESDAYAASLEMADLISGGALKRVARGITMSPGKMSIVIDPTDEAFFNSIAQHPDQHQVKDFLKLIQEYFCKERQYPADNTCLDHRTTEMPGMSPVRSEHILGKE
jgi:hypothetical protein